ncbi:MAG: peptidoglycan DD-metalloendopeptidase family protein [Firmicutes bacterium]|nr:peptidoglycan DD-metalloendopeptidase family protein [Bacillota bacterium]
MRVIRRWFIHALVILMLIAPAVAEARLLRRGMRGQDVLSLQHILVDLGYDLVLDGAFGSETEDAVRSLQAAMGLTVDGLVGEKTRDKLAELQASIVLHTVQKGDNLTKLAKEYDTVVRNIILYNGLKDPDHILPGQVLYIPTNSVPALGLLPLRRVTMQWPVEGRISSGYGYRTHPVSNTKHFHGGIDIVAPEGTKVQAAASGKVSSVGNRGNYGLSVVIEHAGGVTTWYGHVSKVSVKVGEQVKQGQTIALVGSTGLVTGPHLDFRIKIGDQTVDPLEWLP